MMIPARACAAFLVLASSASLAQTQTLRINPDRTRIGFEIDAVGWPRTKGAFRRFEGSIAINMQDVGKSNVVFKVDATSVDAGSASVTNFIKSASMLNVVTFPEIRFRSRQVEKTSPFSVRVIGDMTFMGQTRTATFQVDVDQNKVGGRFLGFNARGMVKRSEFGFISGQPLVADDVLIAVSTEAATE